MPSISYFIREGFKGLRANKGTATGSIITIFLSLFLIGMFVFANTIVGNVTNAVEEQVSVTAYISDEFAENPEAYEPVMEDIRNIDGVQDVTFTSKEQAMENFTSTMKSDDIVEQLDGTNPLPASFNVVLADPQKVEDIASTIQNSEAFKAICDSPDNPQNSVKYGQKTVKRLFTMTDAVRIIAGLLVVMLIVVAFIFMNNTIRLAVMNRNQEIAIQRLVGASNGFIRGPFLTEGVIHATIGAVLAIVFLEAICSAAIPSVSSALAWLPIDLDISTRITTYVIILVAGVLIGLASSALAMRKYLKV